MDYKEFFTNEKARKMIEAVINNPEKQLHELIEIAGITEDDITSILPLLAEEDKQAFSKAFAVIKQKKGD